MPSNTRRNKKKVKYVPHKGLYKKSNFQCLGHFDRGPKAGLVIDDCNLEAKSYIYMYG